MTLTPFDDHDVIESKIRVTKAGDGLSEALDVAPVELHVGDAVHLVLRCRVAKVTHESVKGSEDELRRVHTLAANFGTIVDEKVVRRVLDAQRKAIDDARGQGSLLAEDGDGE